MESARERERERRGRAENKYCSVIHSSKHFRFCGLHPPLSKHFSGNDTVHNAVSLYLHTALYNTFFRSRAVFAFKSCFDRCFFYSQIILYSAASPLPQRPKSYVLCVLIHIDVSVRDVFLVLLLLMLAYYVCIQNC